MSSKQDTAEDSTDAGHDADACPECFRPYHDSRVRPEVRPIGFRLHDKDGKVRRNVAKIDVHYTEEDVELWERAADYWNLNSRAEILRRFQHAGHNMFEDIPGENEAYGESGKGFTKSNIKFELRDVMSTDDGMTKKEVREALIARVDNAMREAWDEVPMDDEWDEGYTLKE